jgi:hypothetical protein
VLAAASVSIALTILLVHALRQHLLGALHPLVLTVSHQTDLSGVAYQGPEL